MTDAPPADPRAPEAPDAPAPGSARHASKWRPLVEWAVVCVVAVGLMALVQATSFQAFRIPSDSMVPTLEKGDRVLVNKWSYRLHDVRRGDIVVFDKPNDPAITEDHLIKRVIGLPGEVVTIENGEVVIDGRVLIEPYLPAGTVTSAVGTHPCIPDVPCVIPDGQVWVMGDNRGFSRDSRWFGPIPESLIVGRAFVRLWPPSRLGAL
ncbi:MAG TPA: signal peptidase I [Acidimicrobiales bacterium]